MVGWVEGIRRALVLGLVLIAGTAIEHAPSVGPPGILVCSSCMVSVYMFIVSKALLISSATVIVRTGGAIWLNPFAMVLFNVCSAVTVECCVLYPCCVSVFGMFAVMEGRRPFSSVFAITERGDMGQYEVPLSMLVLRALFYMLVRNASPRGPMCFSVLLYPCILCVALLMDLFVLCVACLTVFVNCLVKQFVMCLDVVAILLLNVMGKCLVWVEVEVL